MLKKIRLYSRGGAIAVGFCSRRERLGSTLNTISKNGGLETRSMLGVLVDGKLLRERVVLC